MTIMSVTFLLLMASSTTSHVVLSFITTLLLPDKVRFIYHPHISFLMCCPVIYDCLELWYSLQCPVTLVTLLPMRTLPPWPLGQFVEATNCSAYVHNKAFRPRSKSSDPLIRSIYSLGNEKLIVQINMLRVQFVHCVRLCR